MYSHICFADILLGQDSPVCNFLSVINLINQFTIIYNYILILFDKMKITLSILFNNWVNSRKRFFSASWAIFSCMVLSIVENISFMYYLLTTLYYLTWAHGGINSWDKAYGLRNLNEVMASDYFAFTKAKSCRQDDLKLVWH